MCHLQVFEMFAYEVAAIRLCKIMVLHFLKHFVLVGNVSFQCIFFLLLVYSVSPLNGFSNFPISKQMF